ncbi:22484_t:CDS:2, partial [Rhizophagus irregularis]
TYESLDIAYYTIDPIGPDHITFLVWDFDFCGSNFPNTTDDYDNIILTSLYDPPNFYYNEQNFHRFGLLLWLYCNCDHLINFIRAENPHFTNQFLRIFKIYDNNLDSILLIGWFFTAITSTLKFFTNMDDMCYGFSDLSVTLAVILCASHIIGYILCLLMFLSCIIRMVIKYRENSHQNDDEYEYAPLLRDDVDAKLIDDEEINVKCIEAYKKETEVDVKLIDI